MGRLFLMLAALAAFAAAPRGVEDPRAFVAGVFENYRAHPDSPPPDAAFAYSRRLGALFADYDRWQRRHDDLVGALDFDWWVNAQDWSLSNLSFTQSDPAPDRRVIEAHWTNIDRADSTRFFFIRENGRWVLDDAINGSGHGDDGWTLSALLRERDVP